jgi:hypothetical protein
VSAQIFILSLPNAYLLLKISDLHSTVAAISITKPYLAARGVTAAWTKASLRRSSAEDGSQGGGLGLDGGGAAP